ncbi:MAG: formylglycine-generating enzyme family protein [Planctomycetes bacterium]|jgi:formylglycine-generating enzyme required for sulfatase activity|nr:formylglycine-generating enzyme family protein [Planctomycetota bacterium]
MAAGRIFTVWKRAVALCAILALMAGIVVLAWAVAGLPPVSLVAEHGFPPAGGPTGQVREVEGVTFVELAPGYSRMGSWFRCDRGDFPGRVSAVFGLPWGRPPTEEGDEVPLRWVVFPRCFWIARTEVTNEQFERFDVGRPRSALSSGDRDPAVNVSWEAARRYCEWLSSRGDLDVRLPSEAEWEHAARAGSSSEYCFGDDPAGLAEYGWFIENSGGRAREVGTRKPNGWGLHDFHGNVWEWCADAYHSTYRGAPPDGRPRDREGSTRRLRRGGCWSDPAGECRSANRARSNPKYWGRIMGFRPAADPR